MLPVSLEWTMPQHVEVSPIIIRRYGRRRLYDADRGQYLTVDTLREWQSAAIPFVVIDVETKQDVTGALLA
jgi:polyhydroxyalkanoate synthesis regulator protein